MIKIDKEMLELLSKGWNREDIATCLDISVSYIKKRISILKDAFNAKTLFELGYKFARNEK